MNLFTLESESSVQAIDKDTRASLAMNETVIYEVVDLHAGGEPARVVLGGLDAIDYQGKSMRALREQIMTKHDHIRKTLLQEPRGYPCQNANLVFPLEDGTKTTQQKEWGVSFGFVIMEQNKIYPMMSGHNTLCVATALLESGKVPIREPEVQFCLEAPAGVIEITARCRSGRAESVTFKGTASFVAKEQVSVAVPELGDVLVDVAYGGMWYAIVDADSVGLELLPSNGKRICRIGEMIKVACREAFPVEHPENHQMGCEILVFLGRPSEGSKAHGKNAVVMSNAALDWEDPNTWTGMIDRSPCGTGTCAVMALMYHRGQLGLGDEFVHESIVGTTFVGKLLESTSVGKFPAVVPQITGQAWITARSEVIVHHTDPFPQGYTVSDIWA